MNKMMQASRRIAIERVILTESSKLPKEELSDLLNPNQKIVYITVTNYVTRYVSLTLQESTSLPSSQSKQVLPSSFTANQATLFTSPLIESPSPSSSPQSPTTIVSEIITPTITNSHVQKFADSVVPVEYTTSNVTTACGNCQKRKIKCSGETPCSYCVKINKPCLPGKPGKKRGPPPGTEVNKNRKKFINTSFSQFNNSYHYQQRHVVNYSPDCGQDYDDININNNPRDCLISPNSDENTENITRKIIVRNNNDIPLIKPIPIYPQSNTSTVIVNSCPNNSLLEEEKQSDEIEKDSSSIFKKSESSTTNERSPISGSNNRNSDNQQSRISIIS
nr:13132_t:CDS:2 [Entrophospora candida]